jgi:CRISPR/Cas system-associated endonuclease Cas1
MEHDLLRKEQTNSNSILKQCKLTCRYDIQIENEKDFQVARRIIGSKGMNMKKIIESALEQIGEKNSNSSNEILKLRLRGRGSGYKEGP